MGLGRGGKVHFSSILTQTIKFNFTVFAKEVLLQICVGTQCTTFFLVSLKTIMYLNADFEI